MEGSVYTDESSDDLCFVSTINWRSIAPKSVACPYNRVPSGSNSVCSNYEQCPSYCPKWSDNQRYCWSEDSCQYECKCEDTDKRYTKITKRFCRLDKFDGDNCCHETCLGGCYGPGPEDCVACKDWTVLENGKCNDAKERCPNHTLELMDRYCVSANYCLSLEVNPGQSYKIYKSKCHPTCPTDTNDHPTDPTTCVACIPNVDCRRVRVENMTIMYLQHFPTPESAFTDLVGNMVINLEEMTPQRIKSAENNLRTIRNITGSLKVFRSERIQGLDFFDTLEEIGSGGCYMGFCLTIHSNEFLQHLWKPKKGFLRIKNGNISIAHNPRLCQSAIDEFEKYLDKGVYIHQEGNGDRGYCSSMPIIPVKDLEQRRTQLTSSPQKMSWWTIGITAGFNLSNTDRILTLSLYYRKTDAFNNNLTFYDPAFCDDSGENRDWHRHVISVNFSSPENWVVHQGVELFVTNITSPGLDPKYANLVVMI